MSRPAVGQAPRLETLGERISGGEAHDLAGQLPPELQGLVDRHTGDGPRPLSAGEFFQRVQLREQVPIMEARDHVRAVFVALRQSVDPEEIADLASEPPRELEMLLFDDLPLEDLDEGVAGRAAGARQGRQAEPVGALAAAQAVADGRRARGRERLARGGAPPRPRGVRDARRGDRRRRARTSPLSCHRNSGRCSLAAADGLQELTDLPPIPRLCFLRTLKSRCVTPHA